MSVILSTGEGGCAWQGRMRGRVGVCVVGGMHGRGCIHGAGGDMNGRG